MGTSAGGGRTVTPSARPIGEQQCALLAVVIPFMDNLKTICIENPLDFSRVR